MLDRSGDLNLADLWRLVWQHRRRFVLAFVLGILLGAGSAVLPRSYESKASFVGVGGTALRLPTSLGGLGDIASQLGLSGLGGGEASTASPYFLASLLTADTILSQLADVPLPDPKPPGGMQPMTVLLHAGGRSRADTIQRAVNLLRRMIVVDLDARTGVIKLILTAGSPELAGAAADTLLGFVNAFLTRGLRTRAGAQRRFLQERLAETRQDLSDEQNRLRAFLEANRDYRGSPALVFREQELQREVDLKRDVYVSVARSLEEARMNEVRDTPLLSVIDRPSRPLRAAGPRPKRNAALLGMFAPLLVLVGLLLRWPPETARAR